MHMVKSPESEEQAPWHGPPWLLAWESKMMTLLEECVLVNIFKFTLNCFT